MITHCPRCNTQLAIPLPDTAIYAERLDAECRAEIERAADEFEPLVWPPVSQEPVAQIQ